MLKKTENRGAECWCWCWHWPPVTTGWKESCSLMQLLSPGYWPSDNTATAVARCSVSRCTRCWVQVRMYRVMVTFDPTHCVATPLDSESRQPRPSYERSFVPATTATAATDTGTRDSRGECRAEQCGEWRLIIRGFSREDGGGI